MRTGEFWEEGSPFFCSPVQTLKKEDVIALLKKVSPQQDLELLRSRYGVLRTQGSWIWDEVRKSAPALPGFRWDP
ncbi:hypothetical protein LEMLEM_LOCUS4436 [Lemmus lemmus]